MVAPGEYREWRPATPLREHVACRWAGRLAADGTPYTDQVLPDGCIDLFWDGARLFLAGPDTGPVPIARRPHGVFAGVRFRPGQAPSILGLPASVLRDLRVEAVDVLGSRAADLASRLADHPEPAGAAETLEQAVLAWLPAAEPPDLLVDAAVAALRSVPAGTPVRSLSARLGVSERQLHRRCSARVGYGPKTLHRVLRFRAFLALAERSAHPRLAELAAAAGYADQAHLSRDARALAGVAPSALLR